MADETETLTDTPELPQEAPNAGAMTESEAAENPGETLDLDELGAEPSVPAVATGETEAGDNKGDDAEDMLPRPEEIGAVYDVPVQVQAVLGRTSMQVNQLLKLGRGAVVELDRKVGEAIDIYVNNRLVARGEVVVVEDRLGVTMTEIIKSETA